MDVKEKKFAELLQETGKAIFENEGRVNVELVQIGAVNFEFVLKFDAADLQGTDEYVSRVTRAVRLIGALAFRKSLESSGKRYSIAFQFTD